MAWCDRSVGVTDVTRWRAAFPAATGAQLVGRPTKAQYAALAGLVHLECVGVKGRHVDPARLPATLLTLKHHNDEMRHRVGLLHWWRCGAWNASAHSFWRRR